MNPVFIAFALILFGATLALGSIMLGVAHLSLPAANIGQCNKTIFVGYVDSINWMSNLCILGPIIIASYAKSRQCVPDLLKTLIENQMVFDQTTSAKSSQTKFDNTWDNSAQLVVIKKRVIKERHFQFAIGVVLLFFAVYRWYVSSAVGLLFPPPNGKLPVPTCEDLDWAVAATCWPGFGWKGAAFANAMFSLLASALQFVYVAGVLCTLLFICRLSAWVSTLARPQSPIQLLPNLTDPDRRRGFQEFGDLVGSLLLGCLMLFCCLFVIRIHYWYMTVGSGTIIDFLAKELVQSVNVGALLPNANENFGGWLMRIPNGGRDVLISAFSVPQVFHHSQTAVFMGAAFLIFGVLFVVPTLFLGVAARAARRRAGILVAADALFADRYWHITSERATELLANMSSWPLHYPNLNAVYLLVLMGAVALVFPRIALFWAALGLLLVIVKGAKMIRRAMRDQTNAV